MNIISLLASLPAIISDLKKASAAVRALLAVVGKKK